MVLTPVHTSPRSISFNNNGLVTSGSDVFDVEPGPALIAQTRSQPGSLIQPVIGDKASMPKRCLLTIRLRTSKKDQPTVTSEDHVGCLWYQESTAQLRMYNGNSWMPVGFGRLSKKTYGLVAWLMQRLALSMPSPKQDDGRIKAR